jgi:hypothetical protein
VLDCHYTGRRCDKAPKGFVFPEPVGYTGPRRKVGVSKAEAERLLADLKRRGM